MNIEDIRCVLIIGAGTMALRPAGDSILIPIRAYTRPDFLTGEASVSEA